MNASTKNIFIKISIAVLLILSLSMAVVFVVNGGKREVEAWAPSKGEETYTYLKTNIENAGSVEVYYYGMNTLTITSFPASIVDYGTVGGDITKFVAIPNTGYKFVKWTYSNSTTSSSIPQNNPETNTSYEQTLTYDRSDMTVYFEKEAYTVTVNSANTNQGTVSGGGSVNVGSSTTVTATPKTGYAFLNWTNSSGTVLSTSASYTFTPTGNTTLTANFIAQYTVTVNSANTNQGTVTGGKTVTAGTSVTVTATPKTGYAFKNWTNGSTVVSTNASYTFTPTANTTLTANFIALYTVTVQSANTNQGTVSGGKTITAGSGLTVTATPKTGYIFKNWTNASGSIVSTNASYTFTPTASITLTANFVAQYTVTVNSADSNKGTVSGGKTVTAGTSVTVTATPKTGFVFLNWTNGNTSVSTSASYTFTPTANITLTANFVAQYIVTVASSDSSQGTATGGQTVIAGTSVTVTATPKTGYEFKNWTSGGTVVSTSASYTFTPTANITLIANFGTYVRVHNGSNLITTITHNYDTSTSQMTIIISPAAGQYVSQVSFDNKNFHTLDSWENYLLVPCGYALSTKYAINTGSNKVRLVLEDCSANTSIDVYVKMTTTPYSGLKKPYNSVDQIAVTATKGGCVILIGDDYDNLNDEDTITCIAKVTMDNYAFVGWYFAGDPSNIISTDESVKFMKKDIYEQQLVAKFEPIESGNVEGSLDNTKTNN